MENSKENMHIDIGAYRDNLLQAIETGVKPCLCGTSLFNEKQTKGKNIHTMHSNLSPQEHLQLTEVL